MPEGKDDVSFCKKKGCIKEAHFPRCTVSGLTAGMDCFVGSDWAVAQSVHTQLPENNLFRCPGPLGTHLRQRTRSKAVPGRGGGGWLRRDWVLEDGSGTRVSVRSPIYVGLTAFVSKAAKGGDNRWRPRGSAGKKTWMRGWDRETQCTQAPSPCQVWVYECRENPATRTLFSPRCQKSSAAREGSRAGYWAAPVSLIRSSSGNKILSLFTQTTTPPK